MISDNDLKAFAKQVAEDPRWVALMDRLKQEYFEEWTKSTDTGQQRDIWRQMTTLETISSRLKALAFVSDQAAAAAARKREQPGGP